MGSTDIQVCMDASNWLQGPISHELIGTGLDSPSPMSTTTPSLADDSMFACGQQLIERRLRPPHDQSLKCPRCDSTYTKFCYYNNYRLSQPRYFCKTCRRYWTKGGALRNIPVGGGYRKNTKKSSSSSALAAGKKTSTDLHHNSSSSSTLLHPQHHNNFPSSFPLSILGHEQTHSSDLHLAFPEQIHYSSLSLHAELFANNPPATPEFMIDNSAHFDFMGRKNEGIAEQYSGNFNDSCGTVFGPGSSLDHQHGNCQRLMLSYEEENGVFDDANPNGRMENQPQLTGRDSFGYSFGGLGSWTGFITGYGTSTRNPLVLEEFFFRESPTSPRIHYRRLHMYH